jgi:hypothetical protein
VHFGNSLHQVAGKMDATALPGAALQLLSVRLGQLRWIGIPGQPYREPLRRGTPPPRVLHP